MSGAKHTPKLRAIDAHVEARLSEAGAERLEQHVAVCDVCAQALRAAQGYRISVDELRALPTPMLDWERIQTAALPPVQKEGRASSSLPPVPRRVNVRALIYPVLALAAAAALAFLSSRENTPQDAAAENTVAPSVPAAAPIAAPQVGTVLAVMGTATLRTAGGVAEPLIPLGQLHEGDSIETGKDAVLDLRLTDGSQLRLLGRSTVAATELRQGQVAFTLRSGELRQRVSPVPAGGHYRVQAGGDRVQVVGTVFAVRRTADENEVLVEEGRVEVSSDGRSTLVAAGESWTQARSATPDEEASALQVPTTTRAATLLDPSAEGEPHVTAHLPAFPGARAIRIDGTQFPHAGELAMRLPTRNIELVLQLDNGREVTTHWHLTADAATLSLRQLRTLLFGAPVVAGSLSAEQLQQAVGPGRRGWQRCYERALRNDATLHPSVLLRIELSASGAVRRTRVTGDVAHGQALTRCIDQVARRLQFPNPGGPFSFEVPLSFRAR